MEPAAPTLERKPRRWPRRLLKAFAWTTGVLAAVWLVTFTTATLEYNRAVEALRRRGEPTAFAEAIAWARERAPVENGAAYVLEALRLNDRLGRPGDAAAQMSGSYSSPLDAKRAATVRGPLDDAKSVLDLLAKAAALPPGPLSQLDDADDLIRAQSFPVAQDVRSFARLLNVEVRAAAGAGDVRRAFRALKTSYLVTEQLAAEPFAIPQLIRVAILGVATASSQAVISQAAFTPEQLLELSDLMLGIQRGFKIAPGLVGDRALAATVFETPAAFSEQWRRDADAWLSNLSWSKGQHFVQLRWVELVASPMGLPARRRAAARMLAVPTEVLELADRPPPWPEAEQRRFQAWHEETRQDRFRLFVLPSHSSSPLSVAFGAGLRVRRRLILLAMAYRLKRFELLHRRLPDRLEELCDPTMPELPTRWFEGKPFAYSKQGRAFRIEAPLPVETETSMTNEKYRAMLGLLLEMDFGPLRLDVAP